ncbi:MAG: hypothetical protein RJA57_1839 [Bacteroidota bacterium]
MSHPHDHIRPFKTSAEDKKTQVADMFDRIAGRYDALNRILSARIDVGWRRKAIKALRPDKPRCILDVATGTADMAILAAGLLPDTRIEGIDLSANMLDVGSKKIEKEGLTDRIRLQKGDAEAIMFPDATFDAVMVAFGVRNFEDLEKGLSEMKRVLKPGGRLMVLEFSRPRARSIRGLYNLYMRVVAPQVARWFRQNPEAYQYLNESANAFPDRQDFVEIMNSQGYTETGFKPLTLGICCMYQGRKPQ